MTGAVMAFGERLALVCGRDGNLCVGVDPHDESLDTWGLPHDVSGLERFSRGLIEALAGRVGLFKPQSAFFEAYGPPGLIVLQAVLGDIAAAGALSILDVKRGDIGSTMAAYAKAYLADEAVLRADAITLSPYLGFGALAPAVETAAFGGRGVFVLARTSNAEGDGVQLARHEGGSVAQAVVDAAQAANERLGGAVVGLVVGATRERAGVELGGFDGWILAPGVGVQGGRVEDLARLFGQALPRVLPSASREIAGAGREPDALRARAAAMQEAFAAVCTGAKNTVHPARGLGDVARMNSAMLERSVDRPTIEEQGSTCCGDSDTV